MKIYVAPPKGKLEKIAFPDSLIHFQHEPVWMNLTRKVKGPLLLCGGADLGKDPDRDSREYLWIKQALAEGYPIIGVCRGMQILNEYFGGTVEDLNFTIVEDHKSDNFSDNVDHSDKESQYHLIESIDGPIYSVNSRHHQYCPIIADNFKVTHRSYPVHSIPEAFEDIDKNIWAVQWHPERMESDDNEYPLNMLNFKKNNQ